MNEAEYQKISSWVKEKYGLKLNATKKSIVAAHVSRRVQALGLPSSKAFFHALMANAIPNELNIFIDAITTNKTDFFREAQHFTLLQDSLLDQLISKNHTTINIWSAACASGEEVYSLAIALEEYACQRRKVNYSITGSDLSVININKASKGVYSLSRIEHLAYELKKKYFLRSSRSKQPLVKVKPILMRNLNFNCLNLNAPTYAALGTHKFHIIFCRNVLIYFDRQEQLKVIHKLHNYLVPGGYLFLGHSESLFGLNVPFKQLYPAVYQRVDNQITRSV